jgi:hypothetical protein
MIWNFGSRTEDRTTPQGDDYTAQMAIISFKHKRAYHHDKLVRALQHRARHPAFTLEIAFIFVPKMAE